MSNSNSMRGLLCCILAPLFFFAGCDQSSIIKNETPENSVTSSHAASGISSDFVKKHDGALSVLFIGNSHTAPIPKVLKAIFDERKNGFATNFKLAPGSGFLVDRLEQKPTTDLIRSGEFDYVVLQAQKYSTTGRYKYSTEGAITLAKMATDAGAKVVMYPEWSRRDVPDEYQRIRAIHDAIADESGATVAPIGEAWDYAKERSEIELYHYDGNHASELGTYLNACVFYALLTGESPVLESSPAKDHLEDHQLLEQAAWEAAKAAFE